MRLDYLSCVLTIVSTVMIGRHMWQGWVVTGVNSVILCIIGIKTAQFGLVPANLFCVGMYAYNVFAWRSGMKPQATSSIQLEVSGKPVENRGRRANVRVRGSVSDEQSSGKQHRIRQRLLSGRW
jgi:hypothetical protein